MAVGIAQMIAAARSGENNAASEGGQKVFEGLLDVVDAFGINPDKYITQPNWNVTVGNGSISGGGIPGTQPIRGSNDPYGYPDSW
jgi:hypothetical protein